MEAHGDRTKREAADLCRLVHNTLAATWLAVLDALCYFFFQAGSRALGILSEGRVDVMPRLRSGRELQSCLISLLKQKLT